MRECIAVSSGGNVQNLFSLNATIYLLCMCVQIHIVDIKLHIYEANEDVVRTVHAYQCSLAEANCRLIACDMVTVSRSLSPIGDTSCHQNTAKPCSIPLYFNNCISLEVQ